MIDSTNDLEKKVDDETTRNKYFTFQLDEDEYGIDIINILEIIPVYPITKVPHTPHYLKGIINLRGDIVPLINVRERFGKETKEYDAHTCIIVIKHNEFLLGLIVDTVSDVKIIDNSNISLPPTAKSNEINKFIKNIGRVENGVTLLLDLDRVLDIN